MAYHLTTRSGPNGHALWACLADLASLSPDIREDIWTVSGERLQVYMETLMEGLPSFAKQNLPTLPGITRKVVGIPDMEGKTRVIAICDYWTQTALKPLHHFVFGILKRVPQDCTFNQGSFQDKVKHWDNPVFYSVDLTAATDRFPIDSIRQVLEGGFPKEYVDA